MQSFIQSIIQYSLDFLFPPSKEELEIRTLTPERLLSTAPRASRTEFPFIKSIFSYKNPLVRELIWQIKYKKNNHAVKCAGYALFTELNKINSAQILLIPIPISNKRRKERGYNQTELLIDEIIRLDINKKFVKDYGLLIRTKDVDKQTFKDREGRIENTKNIFETKKTQNDYSNKLDIVIIDDVSTTGSTLKEARDTILQAGYSVKECLTIAH